jgi:catechol 2,3-dioxygenase-like lactoylglutathione lyase family enzyme
LCHALFMPGEGEIMLLGIDHVVIVVRDLAQTTTDYTQLGFTVTPGGEHADGATHNVLITFFDGTYLELIAFKEPDRPQTHPWWPRLAAGEGLADFALLSNDLVADAQRWQTHGLHLQGPSDGGRLRPDGQRLEWRTVRFMDHPALPFVIEDRTPRGLRVPSGDAAEHQLPVTGIAGVTVATGQLAAVAQAYAALLGNAVAHDPASDVYALGSQWLMLADGAADPQGEVATYLARFGDEPFSIALKTEDAVSDVVGFDDLALTHGARFTLLT